MNGDEALLAYVTRLGDNALITGQRMIERVTGEPELEQELANANFALDYIGKARMFYTYAGQLEGEGRGEDDFAYLRDSQHFRNFLMAEQPNGDFGHSIARQFLYESFYLPQLQALAACSDARLAEIAARAEKEIQYHLRHASQWLIRLGDGTEESRERVQAAVNDLWQFTGEFFTSDDDDVAVHDNFGGPQPEDLAEVWNDDVMAVLSTAT